MFQTCSSQYKDFGCDALEICILKMHVRVITTYTSLPYVDTVAVQTGFCKGSNRALPLPPQPLDMRQGQGCGLCGRAPHMHAKGPRFKSARAGKTLDCYCQSNQRQSWSLCHLGLGLHNADLRNVTSSFRKIQ